MQTHVFISVSFPVLTVVAGVATIIVCLILPPFQFGACLTLIELMLSYTWDRVQRLSCIQYIYIIMYTYTYTCILLSLSLYICILNKCL